MNASGFIAGRLRFKGRMAMICIAISFLVMIISVSISSGFRNEIRRGVASFCGDIQLSPLDMNYISEESSISASPTFLPSILEVDGVTGVEPVIYRAGIVKSGDNIHGVLFKGVEGRDSLSGLGISIPSRLAEMLSLKIGDPLLTYFVSERIKARRFTVKDIYPSILDVDDNLLVYAGLEDMQRLNGWDSTQVSSLEVGLAEAYRPSLLMTAAKDEIGSIAMLEQGPEDEDMVATSVMDRYPQLFDWLNLIDSNVLLILILMTVVAGFNMISGLLILLFRSISTIGLLKSMGMTDRSISSVFLKVSSNLVLKGMLIGNGLALLFCLIQGTTHFIKLNPVNYFISYVPVFVNVPFIIIADLISYLVIMLLLQLPCRFISKVDPAQTVRVR
ncbi:MAG: FtsX-like permease family protein [Bacteroidales bacterium]|nr:FtsX-like permease family protein [Bacteroidales bacterium]